MISYEERDKPDDEPHDQRERGGYAPIYLQIGSWEYLGDGKYGIKD